MMEFKTLEKKRKELEKQKKEQKRKREGLKGNSADNRQSQPFFMNDRQLRANWGRPAQLISNSQSAFDNGDIRKELNEIVKEEKEIPSSDISLSTFFTVGGKVRKEIEDNQKRELRTLITILYPGMIITKYRDYRLISTTSSGSNSITFKILGKYSDEISTVKFRHNLAAKEISYDDFYNWREINMLLDAQGSIHIVKIQGIVLDVPYQKVKGLGLRMEYVPLNLVTMLQFMKINFIRFTAPQLKMLMTHILSGLQHLHSKNIVHRDIKPDNMHLTYDMILKICDFASAKHWLPNIDNNYDIGMSAYRASELLFEEDTYSQKVDMWSFGCTFAYIARTDPLFHDKSKPILEQIIEVLGIPSNYILSRCRYGNEIYLQYYQNSSRGSRGVLSACMGKSIDKLGLDLLQRLLNYDQFERISSADALYHPWFTTEPFPATPETFLSDKLKTFVDEFKIQDSVTSE